jgi:natural resistance-associated macrophage protein 2
VSQLFHGALVPTIPEGGLNAGIAMFGAVIMPHNLYLHSALVLTRKLETRRKTNVDEAIFYNNIDSAISLTISFFISMSVVVTFAVYIIDDPTGEQHGATSALGLREASEALVELLGNNAKYVWAIGLLAAG